MQPLKRFFLPLILTLCLVNGARTQPAKPSVNVDSLINYASGESKKGNIGETAAVAKKLLAYGKGTNDKTAVLYGLIYTAHSLAREVNDSVKYYYKQAHELASELGDYRALATVNNALAIYTSEMEMNYLGGGLTYFMKALHYAEQSPDSHSYPVILNNIAMAHYLRNDPNGLKYSLEVIDIGTVGNDSLLVYSGSFVTAYMYYLLEDYATALGYMESALDAGNLFFLFQENHRNAAYEIQRADEKDV